MKQYYEYDIPLSANKKVLFYELGGIKERSLKILTLLLVQERLSN
jgi:hypothetical protein